MNVVVDDDGKLLFTHCFTSYLGILMNQACETIQISALEELMILDTVPVPQEKLDRCNKLRVLSVAPIIADAIKDIHYVDKERFVFKEE